jgi:hypothetical protein
MDLVCYLKENDKLLRNVGKHCTKQGYVPKDRNYRRMFF